MTTAGVTVHVERVLLGAVHDPAFAELMSLGIATVAVVLASPGVPAHGED
jgi:hypothetical protein